MSSAASSSYMSISNPTSAAIHRHSLLRIRASAGRRYKLGLRAVSSWLTHPYVPVLLLTGSLPSGEEHGAEYTDTRKYEERGWLEFERRLTYIAKHLACLWDASGLHSEKLAELPDPRRR